MTSAVFLWLLKWKFLLMRVKMKMTSFDDVGWLLYQRICNTFRSLLYPCSTPSYQCTVYYFQILFSCYHLNFNNCTVTLEKVVLDTMFILKWINFNSLWIVIESLHDVLASHLEVLVTWCFGSRELPTHHMTKASRWKAEMSWRLTIYDPKWVKMYSLVQ